MARRKSSPLAGLAAIVVVGLLCCGGGYAVFGGDGLDLPDPRPAIEAPAGDDDEAPADEREQVDEPESDLPAEDEPEPAPEVADEPAEEAYYQNCAEVRAAGAAPIRRGEPGYRAGLDRDDDGFACETG